MQTTARRLLLIIGALCILMHAISVRHAQGGPPTPPSSYSIITGGAILNALDYGVKGDGVTDDSAALNAVIVKLSTAGGGTLFLPPRTYMVQSAYIKGQAVKTGIVLQSNVQLLGVKGAIIRQMDFPVGMTFSTSGSGTGPYTHPTNGNFNPTLGGTNVSNVIIENIEVDGNQANQKNWSGNAYSNPSFGSGMETPGILFTGGTNNIVRNCYIHDTQGYCVEFSGATSNGLADNCKLVNGGNGCFGTNVYTSPGQANWCGIKNSYMASTYCDCVRLESDYCFAINNRIVGGQPNNARVGLNFAGVYVEGAYGSTITGNNITGNSAYGIDVTVGTATRGSLCVIQGNQVYNNGNAGVQVNQPSALLNGNLIYNNGKTAGANFSDPNTWQPCGVVLNTNSNHATITGNIFQDTQTLQTYGVSKYSNIAAFGHCTITGNTFANNVTGDVTGGDGTTNVIANNRTN